MSRNKNKRNLEYYTKNISGKILDTIYLAEILEDLVDGEKKSYILIKSIEQNLKTTFNQIEKCRRVISIPNWA